MRNRSTAGRRYWLSLGLVAAIFGVTGVAAAAVYPTPAYAASTGFTTYTGTGNLTVLPSTAQPLFAGVADASPQGQVGQYLYAAMKDPKKMAAITALYQRAQAGTATAAETAELATAVKASAPVATRTALLTRGVASAAGPVGAVLTSAQVGFMVGGGVSRAMGLDVDGGLCMGGAGGKVLGFVSGADCGKFWDTLQGADVNSDVVGGVVGSKVCAPDGGCIQWTKTTQIGNWYYQVFQTSSNASGSGGYFGTGDKVLSVFYRSAALGKEVEGQYSTAQESGLDACKTGTQNWCVGLSPASNAQSDVESGRQFVKTPSRYAWLDRNGKEVASGNVTNSTGDPDRVMRCQQTLKSGKVTTVSGDPRPLSKGMPEAPELPVPAGDIVTNIQCELYTPDGTAPTFKTFDQDTSAEYQKSAAVNPECGSTTVCELQLVKPDGKVCNDTDTTCAGWQESTDADQWTCRYGNTAIGFKPAPMSECDWYSNRWSPEAQQSGDTLTRPATSSPSKSPEPIKNPKPSANPNTSPGVSAPPADEDLGSYECFPSGWPAFNPVNWVLQPIKCAFMPRKGYVKQQTESLSKQWNKTAPFKFVAAVGAWDFHPVLQGCGGITVPAGTVFNKDPIHLLGSCPGDQMYQAAVVTRIITNVFAGIFGAYLIASYMGWTIGFKGPGDQ